MDCEGQTIDGQPCTLPAQTTRSETVFDRGRRVTVVHNLCSACAHDFDESKWEPADDLTDWRTE